MAIESVSIEGFSIGGLQTRTDNTNEQNPNLAKIMPLWEQLFADGIPARLAPVESGMPVLFGVYSAYESDFTGKYSLTAGVMIEPQQQLPEGTIRQEIESGNYLIFSSEGEMPQIVIETWQAVWKYFEENPDVERAYQTDFEKYPNPIRSRFILGLRDR